MWANGLLTVAQIIGGIFAGSLALIADALHNFSDMAALVIAFAARKIARRPADEEMTFGYGRIESVAALVNYTTLIIVGLYLIYEGGMRLLDPPQVQGWTVVIIAALALIVDALTAALTWSMQKGSQNIRALFLHNLSDALASVAVIIGGTLIILYDLTWVDPLITILIALYILWLAVTEIGGPVRTLMLGSPPDLNGRAVVDGLLAIDGVAGVHHVHLWQMTEDAAALDCHIVMKNSDWDQVGAVKAAIKARLAEDFHIHHSTLEFETPESACDGPLFGHDEKAHDHDHDHATTDEVSASSHRAG
ncbi:MAG: cation diffusion facilitator family transporter [Paracoccus sp. (in: a-proteobacteria)]